MSIITLTGVDPGIVHNGVVSIHLDTHRRTINVQHEVVASVLDADLDVIVPDTAFEVQQAVARIQGRGMNWLWIEQYRDRGTTFHQHGPMRKLEVEIKRKLITAKLLDNTGVKKVVTDEAMRLFGVWDFSTPTHHQDLRSAARIALYGAYKDDSLNQVLSHVVNDSLEGKPWLHL